MESEMSTGTENGTEPNANAPAGNESNAQPGNEGNAGERQPNPNMVPVAVLVQERRQARGQIASLTQRIQELEAKTAAPTNTGTVSDEDKLREQWWDRLKLKDPLSKVEAMERKLAELEERAARGERAHQTLMQQSTRAMDKAEKIAEGSLDKDLTGIGFTKDTWNGFVASQLTDDDVVELFANPSYMNDVVKRCKQMMLPKINQNRAQAAAAVANLPRTPGPGGTPPAPPANEPLKVGKALHSRAFNRLNDRMRAEGS